MRMIVLEIAEGKNYLFLIGSRDKPDREFRERIESQINGAMEGLTEGLFEGDKGQYKITWGVQVNHEPGIPVLEPGGAEAGEQIEIGKRYLLFGLVDSSEETKLTPEELETMQGETAEKIAGVQVPDGAGRTAVILLQDCSVTWQIFQNYKRLFM